MLLHAFVPASRANGPGLRGVLYFQGCSLNCAGCWNTATHPFDGPEVAVPELVNAILGAHRREPLEGITFSGGEPMQQAGALVAVMTDIRKPAPMLSFGMFTGYAESELAAGTYFTREATAVQEKRELWGRIRGLLDFAVMGRYNQALRQESRYAQVGTRSWCCSLAATARVISARSWLRSASTVAGRPHSRDSQSTAFLLTAETSCSRPPPERSGLRGHFKKRFPG